MCFQIIAGMPVPLPTHLPQDDLPHVDVLAPLVDIRLQAISFFLFVFFVSAVVVRWLWNHAWAIPTNAPKLRYKTAILMTFTWGMGSIVILTMISGARELMTPGAWQQQGWTYKLSGDQPVHAVESATSRRAALTNLRFELFRYAAQNDGHFPDSKDGLDGTANWEIPEYPGFQLILRPEQTANGEPRILVMEPEIENERYAIMTNGMIGSMTSQELNRELGRYE